MGWSGWVGPESHLGPPLPSSGQLFHLATICPEQCVGDEPGCDGAGLWSASGLRGLLGGQCDGADALQPRPPRRISDTTRH